MRLLHTLSCALLTLPLAATLPAQTLGYHVAAEWKIGGTGGWDYLLNDSAAHKLYITHGSRVEVLDTETGKPLGAITDLKGTHGIALDPDGKTGYISDGGANAVIVFDRATYAKLATVPTGTNPDGIVFEPKTKSVWAFNGRSKSVSVISAAERKVTFTTDLPGKPEFPAVDGKGTVFVNIEDKNEIVRLDAATAKITATWPIACDSPSGLAIDKGGMKLFSVCDGKTMVITDARTGKQLGKATIGDGPDAAGYNAKLNIAYSSNGEGTLSIVDAAKYTTLATIPTRRGARTMAWDDATGRVFVVTAAYAPPTAPTAALPHPRPTALPDTFTVLVIAK